MSRPRYEYSTLVLNNTNLVPSDSNNLYRYNFPVNAHLKEGDQIAVSAVSMYNSFYNIRSTYGNNTFDYIWPTGSGSTTHTVTIPDGFYSFSDLNTFLQSVMITNKHYLINASGQFVYYLSIAENLSTYRVDLTVFPVPTSLPGTFTAPVGFPAYPSTNRTPQFVIPNTNIQTVFGFSAGTYPASPVVGSISTSSSTSIPQITNITSVLMATNMVNNPYSNPSNIIFSFPIEAQFAEQMNPPINELVYSKVSTGYFQYLDIRFLDNNYQDLIIRDTNVVITIVIRSRIDDRV